MFRKCFRIASSSVDHLSAVLTQLSYLSDDVARIVLKDSIKAAPESNLGLVTSTHFRHSTYLPVAGPSVLPIEPSQLVGSSKLCFFISQN